PPRHPVRRVRRLARGGLGTGGGTWPRPRRPAPGGSGADADRAVAPPDTVSGRGPPDVSNVFAGTRVTGPATRPGLSSRLAARHPGGGGADAGRTAAPPDTVSGPDPG